MATFSEKNWQDIVLSLSEGRLPAGTIFYGPLNLSWSRIRSLPHDFRVIGDLYLNGCRRLRRLGKNLWVERDLRIGGQITDTPRGEVRRNHQQKIDAAKDLQKLFKGPAKNATCPLVALPEGLRVDGTLELNSCYEITELPRSMTVGKDIRLIGCKSLKTLPENLTVAGDLVLVGCRSLGRLPTGLHVTGNLHIDGAAKLHELPQDLRVDQSIVLQNCPNFENLPAMKDFNGDVTIRRCQRFHALSADLQTNGTVVIDLCANFTTLSSTHYPWPLKISRCPQFETLPESLCIGGDFTLTSLKNLTGLPKNLEVKGTLSINSCHSLRAIPANTRIRESLSIVNCQEFFDLPENFEVFDFLELRNCPNLRVLPPRLTIRRKHKNEGGLWAALCVAGCPNLTSLPEDILVPGAIELANSGLKGLPRRLQKTAILWRAMPVPPQYVFAPESLNPTELLRQNNAELRRFMLERVNLDDLIGRMRHKVIDEDKDAGGTRRLYYVDQLHSAFLYCQCPSTQRKYLLRVPPQMKSCHEAAAWMAGFDNPDDYDPIQET